MASKVLKRTSRIYIFYNASFTKPDGLLENLQNFIYLTLFPLYRDNNVNYISVGDIDLLVSYFDSDRDHILTYNE